MSIREQVTSILEGISVPITVARSLPMLKEQIPCVTLNVSSVSASPQPYKDTLAFAETHTIEIIAVVAEGNDNWSEECEAIINEIKTVLFSNGSQFLETFDMYTPSFTEEHTLMGEGEYVFGSCRLSVSVQVEREY